jgi:hypothetical protein
LEIHQTGLIQHLRIEQIGTQTAVVA